MNEYFRIEMILNLRKSPTGCMVVLALSVGLWVCGFRHQDIGARVPAGHAERPGAVPALLSAPPASITAETSASLPMEEREGLASWYGNPYHGRRTSNGETYNMYSFTAAHRTLPYDTMVNVYNLENGKEVQVRINDRGPFVDGRVIDLSLVAARQISLVDPGVARVRLDVLKSVDSPYPLAVQVGAFQNRKNAERLRQKLERDFSPAQIRTHKNEKGLFYRVMVGQFSDYATAQEARKELEERQLKGFIVRLDPQD